MYSMKNKIRDFYTKLDVKDRKKILIIGGIFLFVLCVGLLLLLFLSNRSINQKVIDNEELYTFVGISREEFKGKIIFDRLNNETTLKYSSETLFADTVPYYYKNKNAFIIPDNLANVNYNTGKQSRVPYYTRVFYENHDYYYYLNDKKGKIFNSFLYDGKDLYVFFDPFVVKGDDLNINLSPLSYVIYNSNKELYVFNYEEGSINMYENVSNPTAIYDGHVVNLASDSLISSNFNRLLLKNFEGLKSIELEW